jgi:hypothetical protein
MSGRRATRTNNVQTPTAAQNSSHDIPMPPIDTAGARQNEGMMKSTAEKNHVKMPSMDVERTQTQMQVSTSRKGKVKGRGTQQRCYLSGMSRMEEHHVTTSPPNSPEFADSTPVEDN